MSKVETNVVSSPFDRELDRISSTIARLGMEKAVIFVKQGYSGYRRALAQRNQHGKRIGYGQAYRKELVCSCIVYRAFLRLHNQKGESK